MNNLIYVVYLILPVVLLWGAKPAKRGEWNTEFLSLEQTKALQGFLALCIMLHHVSQKRCASWIWPQNRIIHGLDIFVDMGYLLVAVFLFFNGYGVYKSFHAKENYLKGFFSRRVLPVILSFYTTGLIFFVARLLLKEKMDTQLKIFYLTGIKLCNPNTWYVIVLPFFYMAFYFAFRFIKKDGLATAVACGFVFAYMLFATTIDHNDFWIRGQWWYNCVHLFAVGIIFAKFENKIIPHLKKFYWVYLILALALMIPMINFSNGICNVFSYYGENWGAPDTVFRRRVCLASQMLPTCNFVFCILLLGMKLRIGNKFIKFMGTITLEFYLIHGLFVELFTYEFDGKAKGIYPIQNLLLYVVVVFALGLPSAILLKKLHNLILGKNKNSIKIEASKAA
ncbi:acyltransferase family protein [Butyrivibrio sp. WCD3002]|uniref:acyltransferase family protein n=1 Tax=Butyrivibrio sp. WCD3002 TaxID=1280676 RepID=UPI0003FB6634|nr:acyltransferase family protein [Butyrivibrio sp. WCD3002]